MPVCVPDHFITCRTRRWAACLLSAAWNLYDLDNEFRRIWRFRGSGLVTALLTLAGVVGLGVMEGIAVGVACSFIQVVQALASPPDAGSGRAGPDDYHDLVGHADAKPVPGTVVYRFSAPLIFMNCSEFRRRVEILVEEAGPSLRAVVLDGAAINGIDLAACELLSELRNDLQTRGIRLVFGNLRTHVRLRLDAAGRTPQPTPACSIPAWARQSRRSHDDRIRPIAELS